MFLKFDMMPAL